MTVYISKIRQEVFSRLYYQAYEISDMIEGINNVHIKNQKIQPTVSTDAFKAANLAMAKAAKSTPMVITNRTSSLNTRVSNENAKGTIIKPDSGHDSDEQTPPAQESLGLKLSRGIEQLRSEHLHQANTIKEVNNSVANLEKLLKFKTEECESLNGQISQREEAISEGKKRLQEEQMRCERAVATNNELCEAEQNRLRGQIAKLKKEKEHYMESLEQINIDKVATFDKYNAQTGKCEMLEKNLQKIDDERRELQNSMKQMKEDRERREAEFGQFYKAAKSQCKSLEMEIERLTEKGNRLVAQNSRRRMHIPAEDDSKVLDQFYALHDGVRRWAYDVIDAVQDEEPGFELKFSKFPLGKGSVRIRFNTDEIQLLVAYVWEWLMRSVFGSDQCRDIPPDQVFDLWLDEESAKQLHLLERRISASKKAGIVHEWRSFTIQCLIQKTSEKEFGRLEYVMKEISDWLLLISNLDEDKSEEVLERLMQAAQADVVIPAIELSKLLRQRFTPISLRTPQQLEDAVETWTDVQFKQGGAGPEMEIVIRPQLCKENIDPISGEKANTEVLVEAELFKVIRFSDRVDNLLSSPSEKRDQEMTDDGGGGS